MNDAPVKFALVGCGLVGRKRAAALRDLPAARLAWVCDHDRHRAEELAKESGSARVAPDLQEVLDDVSVNAVIVATPNAALMPLARSAVEAGRHVLVEKPGALNAAQLRELRSAAVTTGVRVRLGYCLRFHPALLKARELVDTGAVGPLMFLRGRYGHGGRTGYDREWRADPSLSGGGELIDQGVHLIDLAAWFLGPVRTAAGHTATYFWDMPVDDNAFLSLRTADGRTAWLHASCTEWKNLFSLEIYGRTGKLAIDGLGGSYGVERLAYHRMLPQMGPPETTQWEFPGPDDSWRRELQAFVEDLHGNRDPTPSLDEGIRILEIVEEVYRASGFPPVAAAPQQS